MKKSAALFVLVLAGCDAPAVMNDAGALGDDAAALGTDGAMPALDGHVDDDAAIDASVPGSDAAMEGDAAIEGDASVPGRDAAMDAGSDGGTRTDFTRPTGAHQVCVGLACYVEPPSGNWGFTDVVAVGHDAFWITGARGLAFNEGGVYRYLDPIAPHALNAIDGSPRDLWAVGDAGTTLHFDGDTWTRVATGVTGDLLDVAVTDDGRAFAVGTGATALEWVGGAWVAIALGLSGAPTLRAVSESSGELWIAGTDRTVLHRVLGVVTALDRTALLCARSYAGENIDYTAVYAAGPGNAFVSGHSNQTSATSRRDVMVRAIDGAISCADLPAFRSLDGIGATDVWGATNGLLDVSSNDADELAHWDGFDWTTQRVPSRGKIACAGAHRAVALVGDDDAHIAVTDGTTVTAVGDDYHHVLTNVLSLEVSPTGVAYFALGASRTSATMTRRAVDGGWSTVGSDVFVRVLDGGQAWWFDGTIGIGAVDAAGAVTSSTVAHGVYDVLPLSSTTALIIDGASRAGARLDAGTVTPLTDTRRLEGLFTVGGRSLAVVYQNILDPFHVDDPSVWQLTGNAWTATTLTRCANSSTPRGFDGEAWSFNASGCVRHFHADGTSTTSTFTFTGTLQNAVGLAGTEDAYAVVDNTIHRLHAGAWSTLSLRAVSTPWFIAVDRQYLWFTTGSDLLRVRHDAL